jgi:hypothetical protein
MYIKLLTICLLLLGSSAFAIDKKVYGDLDSSMQFVVAGSGGNCNGCEWISAVGVIDESTPKKFEQFRKHHPYQQTIYLHSPGGNLMAGMELGRLFRKYKMPVSIAKTEQVKGESYSETTSGICASACAYAFLGGASRSITENSKIGFHQFYKTTILEANANPISVQGYTLSADQLISGIIAAYIVEMGVDARVLSIASLAGKDEMLSPNDSELRVLKVITSDDFSPLQIELFGEGIRVFSTNDYVGYPVRKLSAFCMGADKQAVFMIEADKVNDSERGLLESINKIEFFGDDENNKTIIPKANISIRIADTSAIIIALPRKIRDQALSSKSFGFDVDTARVVFGTWIGGGFSPTINEKKMLRLAWSNCT